MQLLANFKAQEEKRLAATGAGDYVYTRMEQGLFSLSEDKEKWDVRALCCGLYV